MAILNYTTKISAPKTIGEIQEILIAIGGRKIICDYSDSGVPEKVTFTVPMNGESVLFALPANYAGVLRAMQKDKKIPRSACNEAQAVKVAWRILKDWIQAQCAIIEAGLVDPAEVFLPYAVTKAGETLYREIRVEASNLLLIQ